MRIGIVVPIVLLSTTALVVPASSVAATTDCGPAWSPTVDEVAFHSDRDGAWSVYITDSSGSAPHRLLPDAVPTREPAWSPDGSELAVARGPSGARRLFIVRRDGTGLRPLTTDAGSAAWPAWSPDGRTILFDWVIGAAPTSTACRQPAVNQFG